MAFLWRLLGFPPPPSISDQQIDLLLEVPQLYYPPVQFSPLVKAEMKNLQRELIRSKQEIQRIRSVPLVLGTCVL